MPTVGRLAGLQHLIVRAVVLDHDRGAVPVERHTVACRYPCREHGRIIDRSAVYAMRMQTVMAPVLTELPEAAEDCALTLRGLPLKPPPQTSR